MKFHFVVQLIVMSVGISEVFADDQISVSSGNLNRLQRICARLIGINLDGPAKPSASPAELEAFQSAPEIEKLDYVWAWTSNKAAIQNVDGIIEAGGGPVRIVLRVRNLSLEEWRDRRFSKNIKAVVGVVGIGNGRAIQMNFIADRDPIKDPYSGLFGTSIYSQFPDSERWREP